jgi:double-stranded uracil-DNA glycosylase
MPGVLSLKANQYYAHPRNAFWRIMSSIYGFSAEAPYESRVEKLKASGVALWDVLHVCVRVGSLDSAIEAGSRVPNDFPSFFQQHPHIKFVGFNGAEAEKSFSTYALPHLDVSGVWCLTWRSTRTVKSSIRRPGAVLTRRENGYYGGMNYERFSKGPESSS